MRATVELSPRECRDLIVSGGVGRVAFCSVSGPQIFPVNYVVHGSAIVFRTAPYSTLGTYGWGTEVAFEVDQIDTAREAGWSVVVVGRAETIDDLDELAELRKGTGPEPWAEGARRLYVRIPMSRITGRRVGVDWLAD